MMSGWSFFFAGGLSFLLSLVLTRVMIWVSPKIGFVDKPGHRKIHANPKPLGGGVAIFWTMAFVVGAVVAATAFMQTVSATHQAFALQQGLWQQVPLIVAMG